MQKREAILILVATMFSSIALSALLWALLPGLAWGNGDLDASMNAVMSTYNIRGGAVAYFDKVIGDALKAYYGLCVV